MNDPAAKARLLTLGARTVPVLAKGEQYIFCQNLEDVAEFVGLQGTGHTPLPPPALIAKWLVVLRAAQRYIRQISDDRLRERAIDNRDRSIRLLSHHIFRIGEAFLETAVNDIEYRADNANLPPAAGTCMTAEEIIRYGDGVIERLENWWSLLDDKSCRQKVKTFYGTPPMHQLFERSTWHSAQHTRQMIAILERFAIEPAGPLSADDLAGLPLPERVWD
ncbi:MAG: DinB family protein [Deltaproteobacteria bacterium]|nr:DinB family protein [Deltaproteobacteria bacterium]MBI3064872.1 DinB family protein [Deltaproteobacteria bacterium]